MTDGTVIAVVDSPLSLSVTRAVVINDVCFYFLWFMSVFAYPAPHSVQGEGHLYRSSLARHPCLNMMQAVAMPGRKDYVTTDHSTQ